MTEVPPQKSRAYRFARYHLPAILYAAAILVVSTRSNLRAPEIQFLAFDKVAHLIEYGILAGLAYRSISNMIRGISPNRSFLLSFCFVALFALLDEFVQKYVPNRISDASDLLSDMAGAVVVLSLLWLRHKRRLVRSE